MLGFDTFRVLTGNSIYVRVRPLAEVNGIGQFLQKTTQSGRTFPCIPLILDGIVRLN